jgi:phage-related protein
LGFDEELVKLLLSQIDLQEQLTKKAERLNSISESQKELYDSMPDSIKGAVGFAKKLGDTMKTAGAAAVGFVLLASLVAATLKSFTALDEAAKDFRNTTGITNSQMKGIKSDVNEIVGEFAYLGVEAKGVFDTVAALKSEFSDSANFSKDTVAALTLMNTNFGISAENAAKVQGILEGIGGLSEETAASVGMQITGMATLAGVAPAKVFADIAENAEIASTLFKGDVNALAKSAIEARRLGTNLKSVAATAEKLLDFEGGIEEELVAATFVGGQFNLSRARALAFEGKIVDAQKEILAQVQRTGDFRQKDYYTQQQLAKAAGMSVEEITKQLNVQDRLSKLSKEEREKAEKAIEQGLDISNINEKDLKTQIKAFSVQQEQQATLDQIKNQFMGIAASVGSSLVPLLEMIVPILTEAFKIISLITDSIGFKWTAGIALAGVGLAYAAKWVSGIYTTMKSLNVIENARLGIQKLSALFSQKETVELIKQEAIKKSSEAGSIVSSVKPPAMGQGGSTAMQSISKIKMNDVLKGAAAILILAGAMFVAAKAFKEFEDVTWDQVGMGIASIGLLAVVAGALSKFVVPITKGAFAVAILGASLIPFAIALNLVSPFVEQFGKIITSVFKSLPPIIEAFGKSITSVINSVLPIVFIFGTTITSVFESIPAVISSIGTVIKSIGGVIINIIGSIVPIITAFGGVIMSVFGSIGTVITAFGGVMANIFSSIVSVITTFGEVIKSIGTTIMNVFSSIVSVITTFGEVIKSVGNVLVGVLSALPPIIDSVANGVIKLLGSLTLENIAGIWALGPALILASGGIIAFGAALAIASVASKFSGNILESISKLGDVSTKLPDVNNELTNLKLILSELENYVNPVDRLTQSLNNLTTSLVKLAAVSVLTSPIMSMLTKFALPMNTTPQLLNNEAPVVKQRTETIEIEPQAKLETPSQIGKESVKSNNETKQIDQVISMPLNILVNEIKLLRQDMANGKIAVYMDTEKVTSKISRQVDISTRNVFNLGSV